SQEPVWGSEPQECPLSEVSWEGSSQVWPVSWGRLSSSAVSRSQEGTWAVPSSEVECLRPGSGSGQEVSAGRSVPWPGTPRPPVWGAEGSSSVPGEGSRSQPLRGSCEGSLPEDSETEAVPSVARSPTLSCTCRPGRSDSDRSVMPCQGSFASSSYSEGVPSGADQALKEGSWEVSGAVSRSSDPSLSRSPGTEEGSAVSPGVSAERKGLSHELRNDDPSVPEPSES